MDRIKHRNIDYSLRLAGIRRTKSRHPFRGIYAHRSVVRFCGGKLRVQYGQHQFFFPKARQGSALGINGGLGNLGVSVMQLIAPLVIFLPIFTF